ncbi:myeloid leukemia factor isoform X1 [Rhagoletis pomonella]|uniref:myeloid leukemia factor isoform X1 n=1 Tax=Rhagoletis pomonella TaxID=28610 RepID=UPI00177AB988|nr:myeloid leukemia factor isoform X1 [Rhagoletis pomonella]
MSLFGSLMGDFDDDLFMGNHMNAMNMQMRSMNRLMNSLMPDPFNMLAPFDSGFQQNALMERGNPHAGNPMGGLFGFPPMPNINRLLSAGNIGSPNGPSYCSSSVITMSSGPDGRPQIYQATSSTKTGPGGIRETRKTVEDSRRGMKKMAIGHHIGERGHIIEKEQDLRSGQLEERQEFINLEEDDAEDFDREFTNRARQSGVRGARPQEMITIESADDDDDMRPRHYSRYVGSGGHNRRQLPALPAPPQHHNSSPLSNSSSVDSLNSTTNSNNSNKNNTTTNHSNSNDTLSTKREKATTNSNSNNNNSYLTSNATRRSPAAGGYHHHRGITARRPLRTPLSSPLATTPTNYHNSSAATTSVHPHPYNASAARRNYRSKHTKQHQQPHQPQALTITEIIDDDEDDEVEQQTAAPTVTVEEEDDDAAAAPAAVASDHATATVINPAATAAANKTAATKSHRSNH